MKALKAGQEAYWLDQIARNREEYFSGRGESPGRFLGSAAATTGLDGVASPEQVRAMFQGLDPATGEQRCSPLLRADPRSKLAAGPLLEALKTRGDQHGVEDLEELAGSKALKGDVRSVQAACRLGGAKRVKVETVERLCRKVLKVDPRSLYGEGFDQAWQHRSKRVNERVQAFDHCFSSPKSVSLLAAGSGPQVRRLLAQGRDEALQAAIGYLERHGLGVRRDHNGTDRYPAVGGLMAVAFEHRMSRSGDPQYHTHVLVQNAAQGPDGRWTALDSDRLYAHLMAADHLYLAAERAALTQRLGVRWGPVDERSGAAEIQGLDDRTLIERFSKRSEEIDHWLDTHGLSGIKASSAAAVATRAPKDHSESEASVYHRWTQELAEQGVGERQLAAVCSDGRGRPASRTELDAALDTLAGTDGLTGQVSTFTRTDVVDALAKRLPVAPSAYQALTQAEEAADRFLAERAVRVGHDRRLGVDRFSTPKLLALERQLVEGATGRADKCAVVRSELVRQVLDRHTTAGEDQVAMVRDLTQGGVGVALVVGRAGSGKTWALGLAREAFELDGYQVLGCAPTGIATVGLADEGFADARTIDRLLLDLQGGRTELDSRTVLVVDEAAMVATRKLAPLLKHAERAGAKVVLVGDDRQFASIAAGGGFRALRLRLGASELTVNRRQVEAWEQRAIDDVRAGNLEQAIAAYAEHDRIRAFEARDDRDRALVNDWWQAHQAGEQSVIYAHRRAQVDQLNAVCQRLRAEAGQLGAERLVVGDRSFAVGDVVVLGANASQRLGVVNGTTAIIQDLDRRGRAMTVRTLDEEPPKTVRLPDWYLDGQVQPGQSRRVDLAYARTDMRSQGRTERRALLALDGAEDMQGAYVQLTRSKHRTDLYLTVGPEPLGPHEERPHPAGEPRAPEELLARVLTRDGSKTLATDTPDLPDMRRLSTRQLRAERDRLAQLRAMCPPDRSRELQLATRRAAEAEQARQHARTDHQAAADQVAGLGGRWQGRRELATARERLVLAEHALRTTMGQADQATERLGLLRRAQQRHLGWMEANDRELRVQERAVAREDAWRRRVDQHALALDPPGWLVAELGPVPTDPGEQRVWRVAAAELDGYRRAYGLDDPGPAKHRWGRVTRDGRPPAVATRLAAEAADGTRRQPGPHGRLERPHRRGDRRQPPTRVAGQRHQVDPERLLGSEPGRQGLGRRRDWQAAQAALERLAGWSRHRPHHDEPHPDRADRDRPGRRLDRTVGRQERDGR